MGWLTEVTDKLTGLLDTHEPREIADPRDVPQAWVGEFVKVVREEDSQPQPDMRPRGYGGSLSLEMVPMPPDDPRYHKRRRR